MNVTKTKSDHKQDVCKVIREDIHRTWGNGWKLLGDKIQQAILTERLFYIFSGWDEETTVPVKQMIEYNEAVLRYFGLME